MALRALYRLPLLLALLVTGCGQVGPLYQPPAEAPAADSDREDSNER
jgi:predicted small lipoprotein YifL